RTHAAGCGRPRDHDAVAAEQREIARHVGAEETGRLLFADHDVLRTGLDFSHDLVTLDIGLGAHDLAVTGIFPTPGAIVPIVLAANAGGVDDRQALGVGLVDEGLDGCHRRPAFLAAGIAPTLDRFQDRLVLVAAEREVHVDDEQRRPLAEAGPRSVAGGREYLLVAF